ncbi:endo-1,4-beta-xylanase [Saccharothrix ecbatanensis]|uniref:non-reducing end alpha-L-arabinofuranosidase n=1 Tax=Saccharothrix ecbatanensis TaxID=1105145 RepID=A0A7W9LY33_9PSEU|nr:non-reducing end alpha-L-arabinofuranosidase family hydrolase [Saccharothrix ecbatanensis]MBB5800293.1 endo-1,4-beta-xylanase [Saccharothrix ecbatanensis]
MKLSLWRRRQAVLAVLLSVVGLVVGLNTAASASTATASPDTESGFEVGSLPSRFRWSSSGPIIAPKNDSTHRLSAIKDPSVVFHNGRYHVFATVTSSTGGYGMVYLNFTDWSRAGSATHHFLDRTPIGGGYKAAPQIFYYSPQRLWYLVYQTGNDASYSTNPDIANPAGWTAPKGFYGGMPQIIRDNIGNGHWVDMWVICGSVNCYLFSSDDNGHLYRSQTSMANFPRGMSQPVIALQDSNKYALWEAANVYKISGAQQYLLIVEAIGSGGRRYFRSWTTTAINGAWTPLADTQTNPFAGSANVTFANGTAWTNDISHGEMIRNGYDQMSTINPCRMQYLYQGRDPSVDTGSYSTLPWRLALLTQTDSTC